MHMAPDLIGPYWGAIALGFAGLAGLAVIRPWRFLVARTFCPQCKQKLARWDRWGWKQLWTCPRCGCRVGREA
jgi:hypothetical protein